MEPRKYIYFPQAYEPHRKPRLVFVSENWGPELKGAESAQELQDGRFGFYPAKRCQIFSQALWEACQKWVETRDQLEQQFDELMKKGLPSLERDLSYVNEI